MNRWSLFLLSAIAINLVGCQTPPKATVTTVTTTSTITTTPMAAVSLSVNPTAGTASFVIPPNTTYTIKWRINSGWHQRIIITSSSAGIVEKHTAEPFIKALMWHHQHRTRAVPETLTVLMEHKDDAGNWFPSAIQTTELPTSDTARFAIDSEDHPDGHGAAGWDASQLIFEW
jgi:hypothetical protein